MPGRIWFNGKNAGFRGGPGGSGADCCAEAGAESCPVIWAQSGDGEIAASARTVKRAMVKKTGAESPRLFPFG
jgi:hypothetical protein